MANEQTTRGGLDEMSGRTRQAFGTLTGDEVLEERGMRQRMRGRARRAYGQARESMRDAADTMGRTVSDQPISAVLIAAALGFVLGMVAFRRDDREMQWSARRRAM
ncbi:hypothetical protein [Pedomonas mirosovicensis]|uniref:hypothetical protein n=1 Tax=Pedomonas mirosovicensis TaxID=2908641 RepID=UPI00216A834F|nr:hypothetical protein [Pedomonas mirosovicensis]MCH8686438.1 hypothetical protein [Pedomonas mirosovicensis]